MELRKGDLDSWTRVNVVLLIKGNVNGERCFTLPVNGFIEK
jgi:hypothetical protein